MATITTTAAIDTTEQTEQAEQTAKSGRSEATATKLAALRPLAVDVAVPLGVYFAAHSALGLGLVPSLALSSAVPAVRTVAGLLRERTLNGLALLMLVVNTAGIALSAISGDPRLMLAKDGAISSIIGISIIVSAFGRRPLMTAGLKPFIVKGIAARDAAWERLAAGSAAFRRQERTFSLVWGTVLVAECVARVVGAYTLPVETMAWLGTVFLVAAIGVGILAGNVVAERIAHQVVADAE
ncbi:VC0807 family protein [Kitasatospora sp. NPDC007106]|uniref:VC0807 family protein n=1 Tax=Kitasatospora sp. NPDC007106 TaxID=3156914 RepID=UPI0033D03373